MSLRGQYIHGPAAEETGIQRSGTEQIEYLRTDAVGAVCVNADLRGFCLRTLYVCVCSYMNKYLVLLLTGPGGAELQQSRFYQATEFASPHNRMEYRF